MRCASDSFGEVRRHGPFGIVGAAFALFAAILSGPMVATAAADPDPDPDPDYDFVFICPRVMISASDSDLSESFDVDSVPRGATILVTTFLDAVGYDETAEGIVIGGCERFADPDELDGLVPGVFTDGDGSETPTIFFEAGTVEIEIAFGGTSLEWGAISTNEEFFTGFSGGSLTWTPDPSTGTVLETDLEDFFRGSITSDGDGFVVGGAQSGSLFVDLSDDIARGEYTITVRFTVTADDGDGIGPMIESDSRVFTASSTFTVADGASSETPTTAPASTPVLAGGAAPALPAGEGVWQQADGTSAPLAVTAPASNQLRYEAEGVSVTLTGTDATDPSRGLVAAADGEIVCEVCVAAAAGQVIEAWMFSTPRLVAAHRIDGDDECHLLAIPMSAPLDGQGPVTAGAHTLQLAIPTADGMQAINVGVTVGGPVPGSVPAGEGSLATPLGRTGGTLLVALLIAAAAVRTGRRTGTALQ